MFLTCAGRQTNLLVDCGAKNVCHYDNDMSIDKKKVLGCKKYNAISERFYKIYGIVVGQRGQHTGSCVYIF